MSWFREQQAMGRGHRKLTEEQVREIKRRLKAGESQSAIARDVGRGKNTIQNIASGRNWGWVVDD